MGDRIGVDLYMAAIITFGVRIFNNLGYIRHDLMNVNHNNSSQTDEVKTTEDEKKEK